MARQTKLIVKRFDFVQRNRKKITFGPGTRLDDKNGSIMLSAPYQTAADLYVKTWVTNPKSLKRWIGFQADVVHAKDSLDQNITSVGYRLTDGSTEYFWDGSSWIAGGSSDWNTEAEVATNIASFPVATQTIGVIVNLATTNSSVTPKVSSIGILAETDLEEIEDYVWRSLIPAIKENVRPIAEFDIASNGTSEIDLINDYPIETPYNIVSIDSVYDLFSDPNSLTDLFSSYDQNTKTISLNSSPTSGNRIRIRFIYEPEVAVNTSQDYIEVAKVPQIIFETVEILRKSETIQIEHVANKATGAGKSLDISQGDIAFRGRIITDKSKDLVRIAGELRRFANKEVFRSVGQDEEYRLDLITDFDGETIPSQRELHTGRFRMFILKALFYDAAVDISTVLNFNLSLTAAN